MIGMHLVHQGAFFDRKAVRDATTRAERKVLSRFGAFVRQRARTSIRPRPGISPPGSPPYSHTGLLRRGILFAYDRNRRSVVVGPAALNQKQGEAPALLEHGGTTMLRRRGRQRRAVYAPRPYMRPAFDIERPKLPALWRDAIR